jgi:hypothetical protein
MAIVIFVFIGIWLAGGFATWGTLTAIDIIEGNEGENKIDQETLQMKFIQSWYAFGQIIMVVLLEIGTKVDNIKITQVEKQVEKNIEEPVVEEVIDKENLNMFGQKVSKKD